MKSALLIILLILIATFLLNSTASAQVTVIRTGSENPVLTIGKSTFYGAVTGTFLGLALSLVVDESFEDVMKWSFVGGTLAGFALGVYHVANRPQPSSAALLEFNSQGLAQVRLPEPQLSLSRLQYSDQKSLDVKVPILSLSL